MVEIKTFLDGFNDLERLNEVRTKLNEAKHKVRRVLVDSSSIGSLDDRSILTDDERARFLKLSDALEKAADLVTDKLLDQERKCVKMNVIGFAQEGEKKPEEAEEDEFF